MRIAVLGAGGCAREVAWTIREIPDFEFAGYVVSDLSRLGPNDHVSSPIYDFERLPQVDALVLGVGAPALRRKLLAEGRKQRPDAAWPVVIHPSVQSDFASCTFGEGTVICASVVLTVNVTIGPHVLVHYGTTVSHEVSIGEGCNINPGCAISGGVTIEEDVVLGTNASVIQYLRIGARAVVGAGAVVTRDVPPDTTVAGVPAKPLK